MLLKNYQEILVDFDMDATSLWLLPAPSSNSCLHLPVSFFSQHQTSQAFPFFPIPKGYINKTTDGLFFFFGKSMEGVPRLLHLAPHTFGRSQISHHPSSRKAVRDTALEG